MPKGYLIANLTITDADRYEAYRRDVPEVIRQYGGRYLVRGGRVDKREAADGFDRVVVIEFDSVEAAQRFYDSPEYKPLLELRGLTARSDVALVEGV